MGIFNCRDDPATLGTRWTRWLASSSSSSHFCAGQRLTPHNRTLIRTVRLQPMSGNDARRLYQQTTTPRTVATFSWFGRTRYFLTLLNNGRVRDYDTAVTSLNAYFIPKVNPAYARHAFRQINQRPGETVRQFVTRLWTSANN